MVPNNKDNPSESELEELRHTLTETNDRTSTVKHQKGQTIKATAKSTRLRITQPSEGLLLAWNQRVPDHLQAFELRISGVAPGSTAVINWFVDGDLIGTSTKPHQIWPLQKGPHSLLVSIESEAGEIILGPTKFEVRP